VFHFLSFLLVRNLYTQLLDFSFSFIFVQSPLLQRAVQRANEPNLEPCEILRESLALLLLSLALKTSNSDQNSTKITMRPSSSFSFPLIALFLSLLMTPCLGFFEHLFNQQGGGQPQAPPSISFTDQFSSRTSLPPFPLLPRITLIVWERLVVPCASYVCPDSLTCVEKPKDCPCPYKEFDKKCLIKGSKDGEFVCSRDCGMVDQAIKA